MPPPLYIALRFATHRKWAFFLSLSGVVFGVAIFICSQAQTEGFARSFIKSTLGSNGALIVRSRLAPKGEKLPVGPAHNTVRRDGIDGITDASEIMRVSRQFSDVVACSPVLRGSLSARSGFQNATVDLFGIDPAAHVQTTDLAEQLINGSFDDFRNNPMSVILGSRLADALGAIIAVFIATYVPARRAAALPPVATLRGSSA